MPTFHKIIVFGFLLISALSVIVAMFRSKKPIKSLFTSALQGILSLFAVNVLADLTGVSIAVNACTLSACAVLGLPGVISTLLLDTIFKIL